MKRLLAIITTVLVLMPEAVLAKGKAAGSCAQAVSQASVQTLQGTAIIVALVVTGIWIVNLAWSSRRKDKELAKFKGDPKTSTTGIFSRP